MLAIEKARTDPALGLRLGLALLVVAVIGVNAWVCDDAFITLRSAKNLVEGRGAVFNLGWRVQSYTHPAWMLLLAAAWGLTREAFWTTLALALGVSAAAVYLGLGRCRRGAGALVCAVGLASSRAFVEFSTSGLENPLTHLILVGAAALLVSEGPDPRRRLGLAGLLLSASFLARPDAILLLAPTFVDADRQARAAGLSLKARAKQWAIAAAPALAWVLVALIYYGTPIPNTAVAKLGAIGISRGELVARGLTYIGRAATGDPVTVVLLAAALVVPWLGERVGGPPRPSPLRPLSLGAAAYLVYVIAIGGDFMEGRFLTAPALVGALALGRLRWSLAPALIAALALALLPVLGARHPFIPDPGSDDFRREGGIADERSYYAQYASVLAWEPGRSLPDHSWRTRGEQGPEDGGRVVLFSTMGFYGFFADPSIHVVDRFALADPLIARVPAVRRVDWTAGHLPRIMPPGYLETLADPMHVQLEDPALAELYAVVVRVHHGPIFARGRLRAMVALASGRAAAGIDVERYHLAELVRFDARILSRRRKSIRFRDAGVEIALEHTEPGQELAFALSPGQTYALTFYAGDTVVEVREFEVPGEVDDRVHPIAFALPSTPCDRLRLVPQTMHGRRSLELRPGK